MSYAFFWGKGATDFIKYINMSITQKIKNSWPGNSFLAMF